MNKIGYRSKLGLCIICTCIFLAIEAELSFLPAEETVVSFNKYLSCLILLWAYAVAGISGKGFFHPFMLYLVSYTTFVYSRLIMDVIGLRPFDDGGIFGNDFFFTSEIRHKILLAVSFATLSLTLGALCAFRKGSKTPVPAFQETDLSSEMRKAGLFLIAVSIIPFLTLKIKTMMTIASNGYLYSMMEGGMYENRGLIDRILNISDNFFYTAILLYLATYPSGKIYRCVIAVFLVGSVLELGGGMRGPTICNIFVLMAYLGCRGLKFSLKKMCLLALSVVFFLYFSFAFVSARTDSIKDVSVTDTGLAVSEVAEIFFWQQGVTLDVVIGETIRSEEHIKNKGLCIFSPLKNFLFGSVFSDILGIREFDPAVQDNRKAEKSWSLGGKLMRYISPNAYYSGNGTGSSIVAESYCCGGLFGTVFWPFVYMYLFILLWDRYHKKPYAFFLLLSGLALWYYSPRADTFMFLLAVFYAFLLMSLVRFALKYLPEKARPTTGITNYTET